MNKNENKTKEDIKKSKEYNDKAASIKPNDPAVIYNNEYFDSIEK